jgi:thiopurine S-methyltransferase
MKPDFWHQRWQDNEIGFHQDQATPLLLKHWTALGAPAGCRVFVPLAGKSLDMLWFASQGHRVLGVELSQLAVEQFFAGHDLQRNIFESHDGRHYRADVDGREIELICGDVFALGHKSLSDCAAVFDRAALIALPLEMRARYVDDVYSKLPADCRGLLITLEYPENEKAGPPFPVTEDEVRTRFATDWEIDMLERRDILSSQQSFIDEGVTSLATCVYRLRRRS